MSTIMSILPLTLQRPEPIALHTSWFYGLIISEIPSIFWVVSNKIDPPPVTIRGIFYSDSSKD